MMNTDNVCEVITNFCDELADRAPEHIQPFIIGRKNDITGSVLRQSPEQFISRKLVWPLLDALEVNYITEAYLQGHDGQVDFRVQNLEEPIIGEIKPFNQYKKAIKQLRGYLSHRTTRTDFGIATDGVNWLFLKDPGDRRKNALVVDFHSFRPAMFDYWVTQGQLSSELSGHYVLWNSTVGSYDEFGELKRRELYDSANEFVASFQPDSLDSKLESSSYDRTLDDFTGPHDETARENRSLDEF